MKKFGFIFLLILFALLCPFLAIFIFVYKFGEWETADIVTMIFYSVASFFCVHFSIKKIKEIIAASNEVEENIAFLE